MEEDRRRMMVDYNTIFIGVGNLLKNSRSTLRWVLENSKGKQICIIYVHVPSPIIPISTGREVPAGQVGEQELTSFRERERVEMNRIRDYYVDTCRKATGVNPRGISHSANSIEEGIVEVISQNRVGRLVMGAAADTKYSRGMVELRSRKANYVHQHAPDYCQIQFICKGELVLTREGVEPSNELQRNVPLAGAISQESGNDDLYHQLEQSISKTENSRREFYEESLRRQKTEIQAICNEHMSKRLCDLQLERDNALQEAERLRKQLSDRPSTSSTLQFFSQYSASDLKKATNNFAASSKIGEGGYGLIYKGYLRHTKVAIKVLEPNGRQGAEEFQREIDALSKLRHPNLVTLIGACLEICALIYEYLQGGSLEDRLMCKDDSPPLSWQTRIRIATELCSAVVFLHSNGPNSFIHGDLKPANILLDENLVCKLSDFGICRLISRIGTEQDTSFFTNPKGTFFYMDPEFLTTGVLSKKSDVYSFGIILLRLLTGKPALRIAIAVKNALLNGNLKNILDPTAGEWPFVTAEQLARMGLWCCETSKVNRPDLTTEVWKPLKLIKASCMGLSMNRRVNDDEAPSYFLCPIFLTIMEDPHIAADGFTYEKEAIEAWFHERSDGEYSSPVTNLTLETRNLVPNRALRSAIQEWKQHNQTR